MTAGRRNTVSYSLQVQQRVHVRVGPKIMHSTCTFYYLLFLHKRLLSPQRPKLFLFPEGRQVGPISRVANAQLRHSVVEIRISRFAIQPEIQLLS
jgi:hypothetical protein